MSYEEEDTCVICGGGYMCHMRRRIHVDRQHMKERRHLRHVSYEEEDTCVI